MTGPNETPTVLVAEDDDIVRELTTRMLRDHGFNVLAAPDGATALALAEKHDGNVDLLITDVVMPTMSGSALGSRLAATMPKLKILYVSGYLEQSGTAEGLVSPSAAFLQKPFTPDDLVARVRALLHEEHPAA